MGCAPAGAGRLRARCCSPSRARSAPTPRPTCTSTRAACCPGRAYMWDPNIGLGTVTHQNIGYLWPMGPYYWLMDAVGVPDWVAQRLWLGLDHLLPRASASGYLLRALRWERHRCHGGVVRATPSARTCSHYGARISVILLPCAGLPWLVGLAVPVGAVRRVARRRPRSPWSRSPSAASTRPRCCWCGRARAVDGARHLRRAGGGPRAARSAAGAAHRVLTLVTSLWWIAGLLVQGTYGIPILRYTETYSTVAAAARPRRCCAASATGSSTARDTLGPWIQPAVTLHPVRPGAGAVLRPARSWPSPPRSSAGSGTGSTSSLITVIGLVMAVGGAPVGLVVAGRWGVQGLDPVGLGPGLPVHAPGRAAASPWAWPCSWARASAALSRWRPRWHLAVAGGLLVLICLNQAARCSGARWWTATCSGTSEVPSYWTEAAAALDAGDRRHPRLELPGTDFAVVPLGQHGRPDHPRPHGPAVRRPAS